jgi:predicted nucleic acid-binding protein
MYYFDSAYVAKCYLNDPDSDPVRDMVRTPVPLYSSALCIPEVTSAIHRRYREGSLNREQMRFLADQFKNHALAGTWTLVPLSERVLWDVHGFLRELPAGVFLRAGDAIHLASARLAGFTELWTNDRHMQAAAERFGLKARAV